MEKKEQQSKLCNFILFCSFDEPRENTAGVQLGGGSASMPGILHFLPSAFPGKLEEGVLDTNTDTQTRGLASKQTRRHTCTFSY